MIAYSQGCCNGVLSWRTLRIMLSLPFVRSSVTISLVCACASFGLKFVDTYWLDANWSVQAWSADDGLYRSFASFCGFLIVFRSANSISRYTAGAEFALSFTGTWFNAASSLFSFCRGSKANSADVSNFLHTLIRLISLLVALSFAELSGADENGSLFEIIDFHGLDRTTLQVILDSDCRVECVYQMVQSLVAANIPNGVLCMSPPILSRSFQEMGNGMIEFHKAVKYAYCPMPYPYVVVTEMFLVLHGIFSALKMIAWTSTPLQAFCWTFFMVFAFRFLNGLAGELENPFGNDTNDINSGDVHFDMNARLVTLLRVHEMATPTLSSSAIRDSQALSVSSQEVARARKTTVVPVVTCLEELAVAQDGEEQRVADDESKPDKAVNETQDQRVMVVLKPRVSITSSMELRNNFRRQLSQAHQESFRGAQLPPVGHVWTSTSTDGVLRSNSIKSDSVRSQAQSECSSQAQLLAMEEAASTDVGLRNISFGATQKSEAHGFSEEDVTEI